MSLILVWDTETTGLPPRLGKNWNEQVAIENQLLTDTNWTSTVLDAWPYITQLGYIVYNKDTKTVKKKYSKFIMPPEGVAFSPESEEKTGITRKTIAAEPPEKRATIEEALAEFYSDLATSDIIIGHNTDFDRRMIIAETLRLLPTTPFPIELIMDKNKIVCTMKDTTSMCKMQQKINYNDKVTGEAKFFFKIKSPKLMEAYDFFFGEGTLDKAKLHDALADVIVTLRVFCNYKLGFDICTTNPDLVESISVAGYKCLSNPDALTGSENLLTGSENLLTGSENLFTEGGKRKAIRKPRRKLTRNPRRKLTRNSTRKLSNKSKRKSTRKPSKNK